MIEYLHMLDHIHHSNLIEEIDDPVEDKQSLVAWEFLKDEKKLTHGVICKVQKIITLHQTDLLPHQRGYYRSMSECNVRVGRKVAPEWQKVDALMENYVKYMSNWKVRNPKPAHVRFESIHPFRDGNGRTGRMLMWWHEIKLGRKPTLLRIENRKEYYQWFKTPEEIAADEDRELQHIIDMSKLLYSKNMFNYGDRDETAKDKV